MRALSGLDVKRRVVFFYVYAYICLYKPQDLLKLEDVRYHELFCVIISLQPFFVKV